MKNASQPSTQLATQLATRAIRLHRFHRCVETASHVGLPAVSGLFVAMLLNGLGALPMAAVVAVGIFAGVTLAAASAVAFMAASTADQALVAMGKSHGLADAARTALDLDRRLERTQNPLEAAFIRAHIQQTHGKLAAVPATRFMPAHLLDRLQVIAVLGLCIISTALL